jgi:hypothetical protein
MPLTRFTDITSRYQITENKGVAVSTASGTNKKGGPILSAVCHYVIENTCRKNVRTFVCHYVLDNTGVMISCHYVDETKDVNPIREGRFAGGYQPKTWILPPKLRRNRAKIHFRRGRKTASGTFVLVRSWRAEGRGPQKRGEENAVRNLSFVKSWRGKGRGPQKRRSAKRTPGRFCHDELRCGRRVHAGLLVSGSLTAANGGGRSAEQMEPYRPGWKGLSLGLSAAGFVTARSARSQPTRTRGRVICPGPAVICNLEPKTFPYPFRPLCHKLV